MHVSLREAEGNPLSVEEITSLNPEIKGYNGLEMQSYLNSIRMLGDIIRARKATEKFYSER